jgi:inorganic phosphate transporter, PiT family
MFLRFQKGSADDNAGVDATTHGAPPLSAGGLRISRCCHLTFKSWVKDGGSLTDFAINQPMGQSGPLQPAARPNLDKGFNPLAMILFFGILAAGGLFVAYSIYVDIDATGAKVTTYLPYLLLFVALLIALGLPVSTTHALSSGVAGTMAANGSGLQMATIRNLLMAWVLTLSAAICLSAGLYVLFSHLF